MKNLFAVLTAILITVTTLLSLQASAQSTEQIKYQAVARDNGGNVLSNQLVSFRISILQTNSTGTSVYSETHQLTTNEFGLANLNIGNGAIVSGDFSLIAWSADLHFLKVEMDPAGGSAYQLMGTSQLLSVPYALHAKTADSLTKNNHSLSDADGNTKIQVEKNPNDDVIRFDIGGSEQWLMTESRIEPQNSGGSVFIGEGAGLNDSLINNYNIAIGTAALQMNINRSGLVAIGDSALYNNGIGVAVPLQGTGNTAIGSKALRSNTTGLENTATGHQALYSNTIGIYNTAIGHEALFSNSSGQNNTATGKWALHLNTDGIFNTANGAFSLWHNTTGNHNVANGYLSLSVNSTGSNNTATGSRSLRINTDGSKNTSVGYDAMGDNLSGSNNIAFGYQSLNNNVSGHSNTAIGTRALFHNFNRSNLVAVGDSALYYNGIGATAAYQAVANTALGSKSLYANTNGYNNTASGYNALYSNTTAYENTATGFEALHENTTGVRNTAIGTQALYNNTLGHYNTATGYKALYSNIDGDWNTAIGRQALYNLTAGNNNIAIGYDAQVLSSTGSNQVQIGNNSISYARIKVAWSISSDKVWKEDIRELPYGLDIVKQLQAVDYVRKNNEHNTREMGFIAQDVEALLNKMGYDDQGFLTKDDKGLLSLRYNDFIALLTKGMQEQQEIIETQNYKIEQQSTELKTQTINYYKLLKRVEQLEKNNNQ